MTLLDRYLNAVAFFLTSAQRDDIIRELRENLEAEIDDRAGGLGRPLSDAETADVLRRHGHPILVAGRYGTRQHLIGSTFFPLYVVVLKVGLVASALVTVVLTLGDVAAAGGDVVRHVMGGLSRYPDRALDVFAWTTLGFAALDFMAPTFGREMDWDPRRLPDWMSVPANLRPSSSNWIRTVVEAVLGLVLVAWMIAVPFEPWLALGPIAERVSFGPGWRPWYPLLVAGAVVVAVSDWLRMIRPRLLMFSLRMRLVGHAVQALAVTGLLSAGTWFVARAGAALTAGPHGAEPLARTFNQGVKVGAVLLFGAFLWEMRKDFVRLREASPTDEESR